MTKDEKEYVRKLEKFGNDSDCHCQTVGEGHEDDCIKGVIQEKRDNE